VFPCDCAPTLKEERRFFFLVGFIFAVTSWHARQKCQNFARQRPAHAQAVTEPAEAFVSHAAVVLSLFGGVGGLVEDHNVGGTIVPLSAKNANKQQTPLSERQALSLPSHLTVNTYFFVSTIPKILTEFSFGIGMVNTEKYRLIPTEKYRLGIQL
jgi:hypothetical protein